MDTNNLSVEFSLHDALPRLVLTKTERGWNARIDFEWSDSYDGTVWPEALADADGKIDGEYVDWTKARGIVGALGAAAAHMDFPESIDLGPVPTTFVGFFGADDSSPLAWDDHKSAADWSRGFDGRYGESVIQLDPAHVTETNVLDSMRESVEGS